MRGERGATGEYEVRKEMGATEEYELRGESIRCMGLGFGIFIIGFMVGFRGLGCWIGFHG